MIKFFKTFLQPSKTSNMSTVDKVSKMYSSSDKREFATLGGGCFWCTEAVFQRLKGVETVVSGYAGGKKENPTYEDLIYHKGPGSHAEVVQIKFDPTVLSYEDLLQVFFRTHDPTTLHRQGNDIGPAYRSIILYHNELQKEIAFKVRDALENEKIYSGKIVTEIAPLTKFYPAEDFHQNYYNENPYQGYCTFVIKPKLDKFRKLFKDKVVE